MWQWGGCSWRSRMAGCVYMCQFNVNNQIPQPQPELDIVVSAINDTRVDVLIPTSAPQWLAEGLLADSEDMRVGKKVPMLQHTYCLTPITGQCASSHLHVSHSVAGRRTMGAIPACFPVH
ncbi:hypothetical protein RSAG8_01633, partial [Rhizoctonia solani AG-8 WAC10335]